MNEVMTRPSAGDRPLPRKVGVPASLPGTWVGSVIEVTYCGADNSPASAKGVLADFSERALFLKTKEGTKLAIFEHRICSVELIDE